MLPFFDRCSVLCQWEWERFMAGTGNAEKPVTFLVGAERSGTTLLRLMLDHHPQIAFQLEFIYAVAELGDDGTLPEIKGFHQWLKRHRIFQDSGFTIDPELDYIPLVRSFLEQKQQGAGKPVVGATVHHHFDRVLFPWPDARFLHIVRDPRDVARSCIGMGWAGNVWVGVDRWITAERLWEGLKQRLTPQRFLEVRYEDLIREPEQVLTRICNFMGLPFHKDVFSYADQSTYALPDPKLVYQWKRKLSDEDISLVETKVGPLLESRGYEASGLPGVEVSSDREAQLQIQNRSACRAFRLRRYGFPLLAMAKLARNLPFSRLDAYFQGKIDDVDRRHLK